MSSLYIAIGLNVVAVCVLLGACWVAVRGLGGISALRSEQMVVRTALERVDERITREVKTRAALTKAEIDQGERDVLAEATAHLANPENVEVFSQRPKRRYVRN